jgi:hypothetical protein
MSYDAFLQVMSQLSGQKRARCVLDDQIIFIDRLSQKNRWSISTKVFDGDGYLPPSVRDCVSSSGVLRWQEKGASLRLDSFSKNVFLVHEIDATSRYIPFRYHLRDFAELAREWRTLFDDLASKDLTGSFR